MMEYLVKSIAILLLFLLSHRLLLQREVLHRFNRFYLIFAVVASFLIPLNTIEYEVPREEFALNSSNTSRQLPESLSNSFGEMRTNSVQGAHFFPSLENVLWIIYGLGVLVMLFRFVRSLKVIYDRVRQNIQVIFKGHTLILTKEQSLPHSFLHWIFVNKDAFENGKLSEAVIVHEATHISEKHSWDILFMEVLLILFWFHPGLYWTKKAIQLNHEFIADQEALKWIDLYSYQRQLLHYLEIASHNTLISQFGFSITKKRMEMMKKKAKPTIQLLKILVLIPLFGGITYGFSQKIYVASDLKKVQAMKANVNQTAVTELDVLLMENGLIEIQGEIMGRKEVEVIISKSPQIQLVNISASPDLNMGELADFQQMLRDNNIRRVKYYANSKQARNAGEPVSKAKYYSKTEFILKYSDGSVKKFSYDELPLETQNGLANPPKMPAFETPSEELFESWKSKDDFALWLDGKVIPNTFLDDFSRSQIVYFMDSFVHKNARSSRFPQTHQVFLYTSTGFDTAFGESSSFGKVLGGTVTITLAEEPGESVGLDSLKIDAYSKDVESYHTSLDTGNHFIYRSEVEQDAILEAFSDLGGRYFRLSLEDKRKVHRPRSPYRPYLKLEKDGEVYYKLREDLTDAEKESLPPPPAPAKKKGSDIIA